MRKRARSSKRSRRKNENGQLRDARRRLLDYAKVRKYNKQFQRCDRCNGRKKVMSAVGGATPCKKCGQSGFLLHKKHLIQAHWLVRSPLYRADGRARSQMQNRLRQAVYRPAQAGPFLKQFQVAGSKERGPHWVRFKTKEAVVTGPKVKRAAKRESSYTLFRVGKIWYLYTPRTDQELIEVPEPAPADG